ncbi:NAD(P)/FAD-dependent oxidoreductase [Candidatus Bipolaricaulota bacterium]|nr:NAD(P)/FAD-dependent oxidoreductase [Candidatus Bipolaricaulota bacterium]
MGYDYDLGVIGLGPAGMAVAVMASEMGLRVLGIESRALGGECMTVGCIPSKALLRMASVRHTAANQATWALQGGQAGTPHASFAQIQERIRFINERKTQAMFHKVDLKLREGRASFVDRHSVEVGGATYTAKRFFVCTGSKPAVPPIPGLNDVDFLTNETLFDLDEIPASLVVIGGGAIGCEMAQAFQRLGAAVSIVHMDSHLLPHGDADAGHVLETVFADEGIVVLNARKIACVAQEASGIVVSTDDGEQLHGERLLIAAGRRIDVSDLRLENAGVRYDKTGISVDRTLRTSAPNIFAPGDVNGQFLFSHAAMHQGMIALINAMIPRPFGINYRKFVVPWTVFTEPHVSHVGALERDLKQCGIRYETIEERYEDYGAAIAEEIAVGSVRAYVGKAGRIHGVRMIGEGAGEMINEWGLAIQNRLRIHKVMFLQHSFPSMSFLTKRVSEGWMMNRMKSRLLRTLCRKAF